MCHVWCLLYVWFVPSSLFVFSSFFFGKPIGFTLAPCGGSQVLVGGKYGWTLCDRCIYFVLHTKVYYCRPARCSIANSPDVHMPYPHCRVCRRRRRVYDILLRRNLHACRRYTPSAECNWGWNICTAIRCVAVLVFVVFFFFLLFALFLLPFACLGFYSVVQLIHNAHRVCVVLCRHRCHHRHLCNDMRHRALFEYDENPSTVGEHKVIEIWTMKEERVWGRYVYMW